MWAAQKRENGRTNLSLLFPFSENVLLPSDTPFDWGAPLGTGNARFFFSLSFSFPPLLFHSGGKTNFRSLMERIMALPQSRHVPCSFSLFSLPCSLSFRGGTRDVEHGTWNMEQLLLYCYGICRDNGPSVLGFK